MITDSQSISVEKLIHRSIVGRGRGSILFPSDFANNGSSQAIRKALGRLVDKEVLVRLTHGIYLYPRRHDSLGVLQPSIDEIAMAISKRDRARIIPAGAQAMNRLGLTTQVPLNAVYLTDGSPRTIDIGMRSIKFKKASPKILAVKNELLLLAILALSEIGKEKIGANKTGNEVRARIKKLISEVDRHDLLHDIALAPHWISSFIKQLYEE